MNINPSHDTNPTDDPTYSIFTNYFDFIISQIANHYGLAAQTDQTIEECGELIVALLHDKRNRPSDVLTELADVQIMIWQLVKLYGFDDTFYSEVAKKLTRQLSRIKDDRMESNTKN